MPPVVLYDWSACTVPGGASSWARLQTYVFALIRFTGVDVALTYTLSGGSLGSCVDEECSQLCELM